MNFYLNDRKNLKARLAENSTGSALWSKLIIVMFLTSTCSGDTQFSTSIGGKGKQQDSKPSADVKPSADAKPSTVKSKAEDPVQKKTKNSNNYQTKQI